MLKLALFFSSYASNSGGYADWTLGLDSAGHWLDGATFPNFAILKKTKLVAACIDGAAANPGTNIGIVPKLGQLVVVENYLRCSAHKMENCAKPLMAQFRTIKPGVAPWLI